jgi:hypothetical protein
MKKDERTLLDNLTGEDALSVLRAICASDPTVRKRVIDEINRVLVDVDIDEVAELVLQDLEALCVEDLWDQAGPSSRGYYSPDEMAVQMFEEAVQSHQQQIEKYHRLGMRDPCMLYAMGTLKGIYRFEKEVPTEFKDWATDAPAETFGFLLAGWRKGSAKENRKRMNEFIAEHCPDWAAWATKDRTRT